MLDTRKVFLHADLLKDLRRHPPELMCAAPNCGAPYEWIQAHVKEDGLSRYRHENAYCAAHVKRVATVVEIPFLDDIVQFEELRKEIRAHVKESDQRIYEALLVQKNTILERHDRVLLRAFGLGALLEDGQGNLIVSVRQPKGATHEQTVCCETYGYSVLVAFPHTVQYDAPHSAHCGLCQINDARRVQGRTARLSAHESAR